MENSCVEWYEKCMDSLFGEETDNWLYQILREFSAMCKLEQSEEIIKDTKFRYRALLDTSLDVFTGDRMESKSYQLPFAMYFVAKTMFKESVAAIASEALMTVGNWDYRVRSNLLRFIIFDDNPSDSFLEKMTIFFMALEECRSLEDVYMADCNDVPFKEYFPEIIDELEYLDYGYVRKILRNIRKSDENYRLCYSDILWRSNEISITKELADAYEICKKMQEKNEHQMLNDRQADFIWMDMNDYIEKGCVGAYNPFWIYGTCRYQQNFEYILTEKRTIEAATLYLKYSMLKRCEIMEWCN